MASIKRIVFRMFLAYFAFIFLYYYRKSALQKITLIETHTEVEKNIQEVNITLIETYSEVDKKLHEVDNNKSLMSKVPSDKEKLLGWRQNVQWESKLDQHEYRYLINPENGCKKSENITLLILVKTKVSSVERRNIIRETYGEGVVKYNVSAKIVFLTGFSGEYNSTLQAQLQNEADIHGDILQEDFIDTYHNLTIKLIMAAKWASTFCNNSYYVMSTDDDVIVDIVNLVNDLEANTFSSKFVLAEPAIGWLVHRDPGDKWYTPYEFYSEKSWPPFPRGYAYIVSRDVARHLYRASQKMAAPIPWDDVYCGMLLQTLGVEMKNIKYWFQTRHGHEKPVAPLKAQDHYVIFDTRNKPPMKTWKAIEHRYKNIHNL